MPVPVGVTPLVLDALDAHEDGVVVFDAAWRAAYMNPAAERILRTERVLWSEREPDPPGLLGPDLWEVAREARDERRERTCEHADARLRVRVVPHDAGVTLYLQEVAATRERRHHTVLDTLPQIVWTMSEDGAPPNFNRRWFEYTGLPEQGPADAWVDVIHPEDRPAIGAAREEGLATHRAYGGEVRLRRHDGAYRWHLVQVRPLHDELAGADFGWVGAAVDIHARREVERRAHEWNAALEARVAARTRELEAINEELTSFTYSISHDLRAPLRHASGFADLLRRDADSRLSSRGQRYVEVVVSAVRKLDTLMEQLVTFSRVGRRPLHFTDVDLRRVARDVWAQVEPDLAERRVEWNVPALPRVRGDEEALRLVLSHLVANALKFTRGRDPARLTLGCEETPGEWRLELRDNGVGFGPHGRDRLFVMFGRLHREDEFEGHGVGLALVRRVVTRHGGRVWADGTPGEGATVGFSLPKPSGADRND